MKTHLILTILLLLLLLCTIGYSQSNGSLDFSFGIGGKTYTNISSGTDVANDAVQLADKSIIVSGRTKINNQDGVLVKYLENGDLDPSFGNGGISVTDVGIMHSDFKSIGLQSTGKIIVGGTSGDFSGFATFARFNTNGTLDTSFANNGILRVYVGSESQSDVISILITPDDHIIGVGHASNTTYDILLIKLTPDGSFDNSFGNNGISIIDPLNKGERPFSATLNQDKILVAGVGRVEGNDYAASLVAQINSDGSLDTTFGNNGYVTTQFGVNGTFTYERLQAIKVKNNKIYATGYRNATSTEYHVTVMKLNMDGSYDQTFGNNGKLLIDTPSISDNIYDLEITNDDGVLLAGSTAYGHYTNQEFRIINLKSSGEFNLDFGTDGMIRTPMNSSQSEIKKIILNQYNIVAIGFNNMLNNSNFALAKYHYYQQNLSPITEQCIINETDVPIPIPPDYGTGTPTISHDADFPITEQGTTLITWIYEYPDGSIVTQFQNLKINDTIAPVPTLPQLEDFAAQCNVDITDITIPTATDNCGGNVTITHNGIFPITNQGLTVITWSYEDENGNITTQNQNLIIEDTTAPIPTITNLPDITAQCVVNESDVTTPTATDNCNENVTVTHNATFPITSQGTTVITWTYEDENGNTTTQIQNVIIEDTSAPVPTISNLPDVIAQCIVNESDVTVPTATDNCNENVILTHNITFPIISQGTTIITWTYDDENGNTTTQTQNVIIEDTTAPIPTITNLPDITAQCVVNESDVTIPSVTDNCSGDITVTHDVTFPITSQGTTVITWTYEDENGNTTAQTQNVIIEDTQNPTIDIGSINLDLEDEGTAHINTDMFEGWVNDNCGVESITLSQTSFDCDNLGDNIITITATDINGNVSQEDITVTVHDPNNLCGQVSVNDINKAEFILYPNPARNNVYVRPSSNVTIQKIKVYSLAGERIHTVSYRVVLDQYEIQLNGVQTGTYILLIESSAGIYTRKLLVKG